MFGSGGPARTAASASRIPVRQNNSAPGNRPGALHFVFAHRLFTRKTRAPAGSRLVALRADPEQEALVILDEKSGGGGFLLVEGAAGQIVYPIAHAAMKMVVVSLPGPLVQRAERRMVHLPEPAVLQQQLDVPIDGGLIERLHDQPPAFQNFLDAKRPVLLAKHLLDGRPLRCLPLHPCHLVRVAYQATAVLQTVSRRASQGVDSPGGNQYLQMPSQ